MSATIRLMRVGKKNDASYRIVVIDKKKKRNGQYIEKIGFYNPKVNPPILQVESKRLEMWLERGATISEGVHKLKKLLRKFEIKKEPI